MDRFLGSWYKDHVMTNVKFPAQQGLYCPDFEHDSCGVGFLAHLKGDRSHKLVQDGF